MTDSPDEVAARAQRRAEGIARLKRDMEADGLIEGRDDGPPSVLSNSPPRPLVERPPDERPASHRCGVCMRTIDPRNKRKMAPGEFACGTCWLLRDRQLGEATYRLWFSMPPEMRRDLLARHFGKDPATRSESPIEVEWQTLREDVDGRPLNQTLERTAYGRILTVGVPTCFWNVARERGWE